MLETCSILTTTPNGMTSIIHDRRRSICLIRLTSDPAEGIMSALGRMLSPIAPRSLGSVPPQFLNSELTRYFP
jgi:hypothetical protein